MDPVHATSRATQFSKASGLVLLFAVVALVLFLFAPDRHAFYPRCMLNALTGLQCPGCGGLRATHQLLHGNLHAAYQLNPLIFLLLPLVAILYGAYVVQVVTGRRVLNPFRYPRIIWALVAAMMLFAVVRNLPAQWRPAFVGSAPPPGGE